MRRMILLFLTLLLASGTVVGSLAHATEDRAEKTSLIAALDAGCLSEQATELAESDKETRRSADRFDRRAVQPVARAHPGGRLAAGRLYRDIPPSNRLTL